MLPYLTRTTQDLSEASSSLRTLQSSFLREAPGLEYARDLKCSKKIREYRNDREAALIFGLPLPSAPSAYLYGSLPLPNTYSYGYSSSECMRSGWTDEEEVVEAELEWEEDRDFRLAARRMQSTCLGLDLDGMDVVPVNSSSSSGAINQHSVSASEPFYPAYRCLGEAQSSISSKPFDESFAYPSPALSSPSGLPRSLSVSEEATTSSHQISRDLLADARLLFKFSQSPVTPQIQLSVPSWKGKGKRRENGKAAAAGFLIVKIKRSKVDVSVPLLPQSFKAVKKVASTKKVASKASPVGTRQSARLGGKLAAETVPLASSPFAPTSSLPPHSTSFTSISSTTSWTNQVYVKPY